ncbi:MAG: YicC family protein [Deltaproteobacteria bacterium]|nr:YicC family protein [Deltaproteobacteria bacterium]
MSRSMTGFGQAVEHSRSWSIRWEIKSVNGRHLDVKWKLPQALNGLQAELETILRRTANRGRVDVYLDLQLLDPELVEIRFDRVQAMAMVKGLREFAGEAGERAWEPDPNVFLRIPSLWSESRKELDPGLRKDLLDWFGRAVNVWDESRIREGQALFEDMAARIEALKGLLVKIRYGAENSAQDRFEAMRIRVESMLDRFKVEMDDTRLVQELVIISDRVDVSEELTRLEVHLTEIDRTMKAGGELGRRLDFLLQECFREINTCGNKIQSQDVGVMVVEFKTGLEKIREQVQNLE